MESHEETEESKLLVPKPYYSRSPTPDSISGCRSSESPVDNSCPICLGSIKEKSVAGSCFHNFCFTCLKEWAKQKPVCPLCKQSFSCIMYDIKSESDYKSWQVPVKPIPERPAINLSHFDRLQRTFFRYRSTADFYQSRSHSSEVVVSFDVLPNSSERRNRNRNNEGHRGSMTFRRSLYRNGLWIEPICDITGRYRECSPQQYRDSPALTHRLIPWLNRELSALLSSSRISFVLSEILELIERLPINSPEFKRAMHPHFGAQVSHFCHEFYNFARSPYDMVGHDRVAHYHHNYLAAMDSDIEPEIIDVESNSSADETVNVDNSRVSGDCDSFRVGLTENSSFNCDNFNNIPNSEGILNDCRFSQPGPSGLSNASKATHVIENMSDSNSDECFIVNEIGPSNESSHEIINVSSDSDQCTESANRTKRKIKYNLILPISSSAHSKHTQFSKKPKLDRSSFSLYVNNSVDRQPDEVINRHSNASEYDPENNEENSNYTTHITKKHHSRAKKRYYISSDEEVNVPFKSKQTSKFSNAVQADLHYGGKNDIKSSCVKKHHSSKKRRKYNSSDNDETYVPPKSENNHHYSNTNERIKKHHSSRKNRKNVSSDDDESYIPPKSKSKYNYSSTTESESEYNEKKYRKSRTKKQHSSKKKQKYVCSDDDSSYTPPKSKINYNFSNTTESESEFNENMHRDYRSKKDHSFKENRKCFSSDEENYVPSSKQKYTRHSKNMQIVSEGENDSRTYKVSESSMSKSHDTTSKKHHSDKYKGSKSKSDKDSKKSHKSKKCQCQNTNSTCERKHKRKKKRGVYIPSGNSSDSSDFTRITYSRSRDTPGLGSDCTSSNSSFSLYGNDKVISSKSKSYKTTRIVYLMKEKDKDVSYSTGFDSNVSSNSNKKSQKKKHKKSSCR